LTITFTPPSVVRVWIGVCEPGDLFAFKEDIDDLAGENMSTKRVRRTTKQESDARRPSTRTGGRAAAVR
jgi:hypothetical protein